MTARTLGGVIGAHFAPVRKALAERCKHGSHGWVGYNITEAGEAAIADEL